MGTSKSVALLKLLALALHRSGPPPVRLCCKACGRGWPHVPFRGMNPETGEITALQTALAASIGNGQDTFCCKISATAACGPPAASVTVALVVAGAAGSLLISKLFELKVVKPSEVERPRLGPEDEAPEVCRDRAGSRLPRQAPLPHSSCTGVGLLCNSQSCAASSQAASARFLGVCVQNASPSEWRHGRKFDVGTCSPRSHRLMASRSASRSADEATVDRCGECDRVGFAREPSESHEAPREYSRQKRDFSAISADVAAASAAAAFGEPPAADDAARAAAAAAALGHDAAPKVSHLAVRGVPPPPPAPMPMLPRRAERRAPPLAARRSKLTSSPPSSLGVSPRPALLRGEERRMSRAECAASLELMLLRGVRVGGDSRMAEPRWSRPESRGVVRGVVRAVLRAEPSDLADSCPVASRGEDAGQAAAARPAAASASAPWMQRRDCGAAPPPGAELPGDGKRSRTGLQLPPLPLALRGPAPPSVPSAPSFNGVDAKDMRASGDMSPMLELLTQEKTQLLGQEAMELEPNVSTSLSVGSPLSSGIEG